MIYFSSAKSDSNLVFSITRDCEVKKTLKGGLRQLKFKKHEASFSDWALEYIRPWNQTNLILNSIEEVKPVFLLFLICMFPELNGTKFWSGSFHLQNLDILQTRMDQRGDPMKMNFDIFQIQKWISQTVQKVDEKKWGLLSSFRFPFLSYGP